MHVYQFWYRFLNRNKAVFNNSIILSNTSYFGLIDGAKRAQIRIGPDSLMFGRLVACDKGIIDIKKNVIIGSGSQVRCVNRVIIEENVFIQQGVIISDNNSHPTNPDDRIIMQKTPAGDIYRSWTNSDNAPIIIEKDCVLGFNSRVCKGVRLGMGTVVLPCAVVTKSTPPFSKVIGNPAYIIED